MWSNYQLDVFDFIENGTGNAIVVAVPGSGKTTTLVEGASRMKGKVFMGAFNKKMADELIEKTKHLKDVTASTFHSVGFKTYMKGIGKRVTVNDKKVNLILDQIVEDRPDCSPYSSAVSKMVSLAKQRGIGLFSHIDTPEDWVDMIDHYNIMDMLPEDADVNKLICIARCVLKKSNKETTVIDFDDMIYLPLLFGFRPFKYDWVLVDEAQDTNPTRRELAKKLLKDDGRFIAVGDPNQAIFGFTGADNDSLDLIKEEFSAKELPLSVSYRCPKNVVEYSRKWVSHIQYSDSAIDGVVREASYEEILTAAPGDAILCRYNKYLVSACFALIRNGTAARIEGRTIGDGLAKLAGRWKIKNLHVLRERIEKYREREVEKARTKKNTNREDYINDTVDTLHVLINRAEELKLNTIAQLQQMILDMFSADGNEKDIVVLCSMHRSKGLEWDKVFIIGIELLPSKMAVLPWQVKQEDNLAFVAVTRAKKELVLVPAPTIKKKEEA